MTAGEASAYIKLKKNRLVQNLQENFILYYA